MKHRLSVILFFLAINSFGQEIIRYKIDENISIRIPDNYEIKDTLGQSVIKASVPYGLILIMKGPNVGNMATSISDEESLIRYYKGFQTGLIESSNGKFIDEEIINKDGLKFSQFSYRSTLNSEIQFRSCLVLFLNENTYTVQLWQLDSMKEQMHYTSDNLFSSLQISKGFSIKNQLSTADEPSSWTYNLGFYLGTILGNLFVLGIVIFFIVWIIKTARKSGTKS